VGNAIILDGFSVFFVFVICSAVVLGALLSAGYLRRERLAGADYHVLMLLSATGGILMAAAYDLIVVFLGLETLSIALYVLAGYHQRHARSREAAVKYFVLGAFSSAFFLYGVALTYGATGSTNLGEIAQYLSRNDVAHGVLVGGLGLLIVGLGFKVAAVPFHMWTPDVYQGSPTPVTGFMAAAAKAAGFAALLRIFFSTFATNRLDWQPIVWALAVLSLVVGSVLAVVQTDVKRMLAYSSISHAGYVLVGLQAASDRGLAGSLFYLLAYTFMVLGSFGVVTVVSRRGDRNHDLESYRGLAQRRPGLALAFTVFLLAQAGVPFTSGFVAKFTVISAAVESHSYALAIVAMLAAVIAAFFYLRVIVVMYMTGPGGRSGDAAGPGGRSGDAADPGGRSGDATGAGGRSGDATGPGGRSGDATGPGGRSGDAAGPGGEGPAATEPRIRIPVGAGLALALALGFTVVVGFWPSPILDLARHATALRLG
ncbi:MAG: NADH-quinone oxidoreductase subunit N, partial [Acidimicrobiales bacterium]